MNISQIVFIFKLIFINVCITEIRNLFNSKLNMQSEGKSNEHLNMILSVVILLKKCVMEHLIKNLSIK